MCYNMQHHYRDGNEFRVNQGDNRLLEDSDQYERRLRQPTSMETERPVRGVMALLKHSAWVGTNAPGSLY